MRKRRRRADSDVVIDIQPIRTDADHRAALKEIERLCKRHSHKASVVALVEKPKGLVRAFHVKRATSESMRDVLVRNAHRSSELHTDESKLYIQVGREFAAHKTVEHGWNQGGFYVGKDGQTTNAVENFFGTFKRGMKGTYHYGGEQHLQRYLDEFSFRYCNRSGLVEAWDYGSPSLTARTHRELARQIYEAMQRLSPRLSALKTPLI